MAESIASVILEQLTAITIDKAREAWSLVRGAEKEVKRLESNFKALQLELEGAEEREYLDKRVKHWLDKFRDVSYDMEDVLDDWETAVLRLQRDGVESCTSCSVRKWKVCPFISCFSSGSQIVRRYDIATKIKEINEELDQIVNDKVRAILADLDLDALVSLNTPTLQNILRMITEKLKEIKFLFVFDDVWTDRDQDWEPLKAAFKYGMLGSWILVTTRNESVARQMESSQIVPLQLLSEKICWSILAQKALSRRNQFLTEDRFVIEEMTGNSTLDLSSKKARHLRLVIQNYKCSPLYIYGLEKLRSLIVTSDDKTSGDVLQDLFSQLKLLRLLEFNSFHLRPEEIVPGMENLIHLRYLSLISCSGLENLPEAVCELISLQSLNLRDCLNLKKLAVGISKLINLRYLRIKDCPRLTYYPKGIGNLTSLETLSGIKMRIDGSDCDQLSIGDLENLNLLGGNLRVELIGDAIDWNEAKRAQLRNKIHLKRMDIWICSKSIKEDEVLQALNPPSNFPVVLFDYRKWFDSYDACLKRLNVRENIRVALIVQQAALQLVDWAQFFADLSKYFLGILSTERGDLDGEKVNRREDMFDFDSFK
ncbi:hypothetical protein V6N12_001612 [Hibiscus sabdariffa]|uniref:Uncharacterized protein n=1 Tax=Hibiscus sabdariffa TaxID=183260 RepID=A0ABR1ZKI6_9ROSI